MKNASLYTELRKEHLKTWRIWYAMNQRCDPEWHRKFGSRTGNTFFDICDSWSRVESGEQGFINFFNDVGDLSHVVDLHRKDTSKPYGPRNWIKGDPYTRQKINKNYISETARAMRRAESNGINRWVFYRRINKLGWSLRKASTRAVERTRHGTT